MRVSGAQAYAVGRRELAGELEEDAAAADADAAKARRGAEERTELSDLRDARAAELLQRVEQAQPRLDDLARRHADATSQADEWAATADRRTAEATRLEAAGRTEAAEVMRSRATQANEAAVAQQTLAAELAADRQVLSDQLASWREQATTMAAEADILDDEAAALVQSAAKSDVAADDMRTRAEQQDRSAELIEDALERGVATTIVINDRGEEVRIEIPGRAPVESDLDPFREPPAAGDDGDAAEPTAPAAVPDDDLSFDAPAFEAPAEPEPALVGTGFDAAEEPASDFAPAADTTSEPIGGDVGGDDSLGEI